MAIVVILLAVALPTYTSSMRKSRRTDAFTALTAVQQAQERWRANNPTYAPQAVLTVASPNGLGLTATTANNYYTIAIQAGPTDTAYTVLATPVAGSTQASDGNCSQLSVRVAAGNIFYGSGAVGGNIDESQGNPCWSH